MVKIEKVSRTRTEYVITLDAETLQAVHDLIAKHSTNTVLEHGLTRKQNDALDGFFGQTYKMVIE